MSEDRAKEIIAEKVAKEVVESIGEDLAGALVEYANLVKDLAADLTDEQLEDSSYIKSLLGGAVTGLGRRRLGRPVKECTLKKIQVIKYQGGSSRPASAVSSVVRATAS